MSENRPVNAFIAAKSGQWAFGDVDEIPGLMGERVAVVAAPMTLAQFKERRPGLASRMAPYAVFVQCAPKWAPTDESTAVRTGSGAYGVAQTLDIESNCSTDSAKVLRALRHESVSPSEPAPQWLDREALSEHLGISRSTFYRKLQAGRIETRDIAGRPLYRPRVGVYCKGDADADPKKTTISIDAGPSYQAGAAAKPGRIMDAAQALHAKLNAPGHEVHRLQTELADLRAKLRYVTACAPAGFRLVEGHVSSVKGRETPGHVNRMAYVNGIRAEHVTDAMPGPHGYVIQAAINALPGVTVSSVVRQGVVHVIEREQLPDGEWGPSWPAALTFSVNA